jgi:hypothetical protein
VVHRTLKFFACKIERIKETVKPEILEKNGLVDILLKSSIFWVKHCLSVGSQCYIAEGRTSLYLPLGERQIMDTSLFQNMARND